MKPQHARALADLTECYAEIAAATTEEEQAEARNTAEILAAYLAPHIDRLPAPPRMKEDRPTPTPAVQVTKHGPAYLLPGLTPPDQKKGGHAQTRMF